MEQEISFLHLRNLMLLPGIQNWSYCLDLQVPSLCAQCLSRCVSPSSPFGPPSLVCSGINKAKKSLLLLWLKWGISVGCLSVITLKLTGALTPASGRRRLVMYSPNKGCDCSTVSDHPHWNKRRALKHCTSWKPKGILCLAKGET